MSNQKLKINVRINKQKSIDELCPIYIRIYVDGKKSEISIKHYISPSQWNSTKSLVKTTHPNAQQINALISFNLNKLQQFFLDKQSRGLKTTAKELKNKFLGIEDKPSYKTILDAFDYHNIKMAEKVEIGQITRKTLLRYKSTKEKVITFMEREYKVKDKDLKDIRLTFITEFDHYLLTVEKLQSNTAHKIIKIVKKIMNQAVILDWIPSNPLNQFKCSYKNPQRIVLTQTEIDTLMNKKLTIQRLIEVRDVFIFCCYTGFAYTDIFNFKQNAVSIGMDGEYWLTTYRQKT